MNKKRYLQTYSKIWEKDPLLSSWLSPDPTGEPTRAFCKYCKCSLTAHKKDLLQHTKSNKHIKQENFEKQAKACKPLNFVSVKSDEQKEAELKLSVYIAEHSSTNAVDNLSEVLPAIDPKSNILTNLKLHRTKCSMLLKNVIAPCMLNNLVEDVGNASYSLIIDESTDVACDKILCVMIRYFSFRRSVIVTTFYRLILVKNCNAQGLFDAVSQQLLKDNLSIKKLIGVGVDGASVMVGVHHSFATLLKSVVPDVIVVKCVCHSLHLCAEYATKELPKQVEFLVREIHNYFSHSPKRINEYKDLYLRLHSKTPNKISKLSGTRWLARFYAISTVLDQWNELYSFFKKAYIEDKCYTAEQIIYIMDRPAYKAYLIFLKCNLETICKVNMHFQSDNISPFVLFQDLLMLFKGFVQKIVVPNQLQKILDNQLIHFDFEKYLMHIESVYLGYDFENICATMKKEDRTDVKNKCFNFCITLCKQLQERLPDNIVTLEKYNIFRPEIATSQKKPEVIDIVNSFSRFPIDVCHDEWQNISNKKWNEINDVVKFWNEVYVDKDSAGNQRFKNISSFALSLLSLPISNATVERAFSVYNVIKTKIRNKLCLEMVQAIMMIRYYLRMNNQTCVDFQPSKEMLQAFNINMYEFKRELNEEGTDWEIINALKDL